MKLTLGLLESRVAAAAISMFALCSCGTRLASPNLALPPSVRLDRPAFGDALPQASVSHGKIKHVIFMIQENRSFDNLFQGYPGADTQDRGLDSKGHWVKLTPISLTAPYDIDHASLAFFEAYDDGKLDGWDKEANQAHRNRYPHPQYGYVPHAESRLYFDIASQYVLADHMHTSHIDASYVSHQYAIAAQANRAVNFPTSQWGCSNRFDRIETLTPQRKYGPFEPVCQNYQTLGDELDAVGLPWRMYAFAKTSLWVAYMSIHHIFYGPDWKTDVIGSSARVLTDIKQGDLASVSWVTPTTRNSDHGGSLSKSGPQWVASVVNAIGESQYWNSTAIFVMWDEWGGWYDHVAPPYKDFDGLGFRVPLLIVSPYAKKGVVSHVSYETASVLRFIEDNWGLPQLAASDARAKDPANYDFDFTKPPRPFTRLRTRLSPDDFIRMEQTDPAVAPDSQ